MTLTPEQFVNLMELLDTHRRTPYPSSAIAELMAKWETEKITVNGDIIMGPCNALYLPKKELVVEGNFGRGSIPADSTLRRTRMSETLTCEEYMFRYETPFPTKMLTCKNLSLSTGATLPIMLPELRITNGYAGIQKVHLEKVKPFLSASQPALTKKELRQKQQKEFTAAIGSPKFDDLIKRYPSNKDLVNAIENKRATAEWIKLVSDYSQRQAMCNTSTNNYIKTLLDEDKIEDIETIVEQLGGQTLMEFDLPADPRLRGNPKRNTKRPRKILLALTPNVLIH